MSAWRLVGVVLAGFLATGQAKAEGDRRELDRIVAIVNGAPITMSELEFEARVVLVERGGVSAASAPLDPAALRAALDYAVGQRLQAQEAEKLSAFELDDAEVSAAVARFLEKMGGRAELQSFLRRHEMDLAALSALLGRELRSEKLLDSKLRLRAQVGEADVRRYYDAHVAEFSGSYAQEKALLKERLTRDRYQQLALEELSALRKGADVRLMPPFAPARNSP